MPEIFVSALIALLGVSYVLFPLFFANEDNPQHERKISGRTEGLLEELDFEFKAGKISQESYDAAKQEIDSLEASSNKP